jgi:hypothetical protein
MSFSATAVWGDGFAELLRPWNPGQRFVATGSSALASANGPPVLQPGRQITFFGQPESRFIAAGDAGRLQALAVSAAEAMPETPVYFREHPAAVTYRDSGPGPANLIRATARERPLAQLLQESAVAVSVYSTTLLEAAAMGVPAVALNVSSMPRYVPDLEQLGIGLEARDEASALDAIRGLLADRDRSRLRGSLATFRHRFFSDLPNDAARRAADLIVELRDQTPAPSSAETRSANTAGA